MDENPYAPPATPSTREEPFSGDNRPSLDTPIQAQGQLTMADYDGIQAMLTGTSRWQARLTNFVLVAAVLLFGLVAFFSSHFAVNVSIQPLYFFVLVGPLVLILGGFYWLHRWVRGHTQQACDKQEGMFAPLRVAFSESGVVVVAPTAESRFSWDAVASFKSNRDYLALRMKPDGLTAVYAARSWFADEDQWRRLIDFLLHRLPEV
jgi:hypothetical protein